MKIRLDFDPKTIWILSLIIHLSWAFVLFVQPNLFEVVAAYKAFAEVMPTYGWGVLCLSVACLLLVGLRFRRFMFIAHLASAAVLCALSVFFWAGAGLNTGTMLYGVLGVASLSTYSLELARFLQASRKVNHD